MVKWDRPQGTIQYSVCSSCWITKATHTRALMIYNTYCFSKATMVSQNAPQCYVTRTLSVLFSGTVNVQDWSIGLHFVFTHKQILFFLWLRSQSRLPVKTTIYNACQKYSQKTNVGESLRQCSGGLARITLPLPTPPPKPQQIQA
jgi:hypothetical protein